MQVLRVRRAALSRVEEATDQVQLVEQRRVGGQQVLLGLMAHLTEMPVKNIG